MTSSSSQRTFVNLYYRKLKPKYKVKFHRGWSINDASLNQEHMSPFTIANKNKNTLLQLNKT